MACCEAVREELGSTADFALDFHGRPSAGLAVQLEAAVRHTYPLWIEEPILPEIENGLQRCAEKFQIPIATGAAWGAKFKGDKIGVLVYFGDGASSQGDVWEALEFAALRKLPVVFFCQNNQYAISVPIERQSRVPLFQRAAGFGFPGVRVDGNDVLASYAVTKAALQRARDGQGPTFVEAYTYRMGAHTTTDDPTRYRLSDDVEHWKLKDPIARLEVYLRRNGLVDDEFIGDLQEEAKQLGAHLREGCKALPDPKPLSMFDHV